MKSRIALPILLRRSHSFSLRGARANALRKARRCHADECHHHVGHLHRGRKLQAARRAGASCAQRRFACVLPRGGHREADERFRNPLRGLAARLRLERQIRAGWQRRIRRDDSVQRHGASRCSNGYATAGTDDGHAAAPNAKWAIGHPEKVKDFGYRAVHETSVQAKALIRAFYGQAGLAPLFRRLLGRRPRSPHRSAALSRRFPGHHRGSSRDQLEPSA